MKKVGRNDPCPCGSGKKFKKCCESQMLGRRFRATRIEDGSALSIQKTVGLSSFFQAHLEKIPKKPLPPISEKSSLETSSENPLSDSSVEKKEDI